MPTSGFALGVDFGTSNTVAVLRSPDGRARSLLVDGSPLLPSAVYADPGGNLLVGRDAIHSARPRADSCPGSQPVAMPRSLSTVMECVS